MFYRMRKRKAGLTAFSAKQQFTRAMCAWWITLLSGANRGGQIPRFLILTYANGKEIWRVMSEQVVNEAYSGFVRCEEEREAVSEAWEACNLTQKTLEWRHF
jgi:hypothetical protein